jgi:hypothetical protein
MKTKILLAGILVVLIGAIAFGAFWLWRPQVVTFDDGSKFTLLAVQYGKRHEAPVVTGARRATSINTTNDTLVLWLHEQYDPDQQYRNFQFYAYDKALTACASAQGVGAYYNRKVNQVIGIRFPAFPRRQSEFILRIQEQGNGGPEMADNDFHIRHRVGDFPLMTPDPLPSTEDDNDVSVTLTKLITGVKAIYTYNSDDPDDAVNKAVQATFQVQRNGHSVTNWQPVAVETTDATGNQAMGQIENNQWDDTGDTVIYQFGLWSDEPAWKMRFEFSQQSDFAPEEQWSVPGIPVEPGKMQDFYNGLYNRRGSQTNTPFAETDLNGYHLKVFPAKVFTDMSPNSQPQGGLNIQITPPLPDGMRLTIARLTDDQTNDIGFYENTFNAMRGISVTQCQLRDVGDATNLNLTIALHKSRFVEFIAKPDVAPPPPPDNSQ